MCYRVVLLMEGWRHMAKKKTDKEKRKSLAKGAFSSAQRLLNSPLSGVKSIPHYFGLRVNKIPQGKRC
jgi:hypothetical protein